MRRMMQALSFLAASSCAAVRPPPPLTADTRILLNSSDPSSIPSCNRPALEVITIRRQNAKRDAALALSDAWEAADVCEQQKHDLQLQIDRHDFWDKYGALLGVMGFGLGAALGGWIGVEVQRTIDRR